MPKTISYETVYRQRTRIDEVMLHVEKNMDKKIDLNVLAELTYYSSAHFQSVFLETLGESWGEYITRNRLYLAAHRLQSTHEKIGDISFLAGYSSQANFGKAFQNLFGYSPGKYRSEYLGGVLQLVVPKKIRNRGSVTPVIVEMESFYYLSIDTYGRQGIRFDRGLINGFHNLTNYLLATLHFIPTHFKPLTVNKSLSDFFIPDSGCQQAAVEIDFMMNDCPQPFSCRIAPKGLYAKIKHQGMMPEHTMNAALFDWLSSSIWHLDSSRPIFYRPTNVNLSSLAAAFQQIPGSESLLLSQALGMDLLQLQNIHIDIYLPIVVAGIQSIHNENKG